MKDDSDSDEYGGLIESFSEHDDNGISPSSFKRSTLSSRKQFWLVTMAMLVVAYIGFEAGKLHSNSTNLPKVAMSVHGGMPTGLEMHGWWEEPLQGLASPWTPIRDHNVWCLDEYQHHGSHPQQGIFFVKTPKCASSVGAGITARISHNLANRLGHQNNCPTEYGHSFSNHKRQAQIRRSKSILWTIVRHPGKRALSAYFYYEIGGREHEYSEEAMLKYFADYKSTQTRYIMMEEVPDDYIPSRHEIRTEIFNQYSFIAIEERLNESLVVMAHLFDLQLQDMVVLSTKVAGSWAYGNQGGPCKHIPEKHSTPRADAYLANEFTKDNWDYVLYAAAYQSLDLTIDSIGRDLVESQVLELEKLQASAEEQCSEKAVFPCSPEGVSQLEAASESCYYRDFGCGYKCVDEVLGQT